MLQPNSVIHRSEALAFASGSTHVWAISSCKYSGNLVVAATATVLVTDKHSQNSGK